MKELPKKYKSTETEANWKESWFTDKIYKWDPNISREESFVIDTPPPTASGSLHFGHIFSYTQTDIVARYKRMSGLNVFYPIGWDDNGLPTERRVQNYFNIKCNPNVEDKNIDFSSFKHKEKRPLEVSRNDFITACQFVTKIDEVSYENTFKTLGLSYDWDQKYSTINNHCRKISQLAFIKNYNKGYCKNKKAPTMWDIDFQSAVAQAEIEDKNMPSQYNFIEFQTENSKSFTIATTRPELLVACIAVVAHPDDKRYKDLFGTNAIVPLFHYSVPIMPSIHADPEKGSGIMMICTFGDITDVEFWQNSKLPAKEVISKSGHIKSINFERGAFKSLKPEIAKENFKLLDSCFIKKARKITLELLENENSSVCGTKTAIVKDPEKMEHPVKFYEKGSLPIEYILTRQWFVDTMESKEILLKRGDEINWYPSHMQSRYTNWVQGLNQNWCISRQRYYGVPIPVWYKIDDQGCIDYQEPLLPDEKSLPIDPFIDTPKGYTEADRNRENGFIHDKDVMDTWATSSLTPHISGHLGTNEQRYKNLFPADVRPQAHDIIRTWAFYTILQAEYLQQTIPWKDIIISGFVLGKDRKKLSKSKGKNISPSEFIEKYSADSIRYWASKIKLGTDTTFDETTCKIGFKLVTKLFNASKFIMMQFERLEFDIKDIKKTDITNSLDLSFLLRLKESIKSASTSLDKYEYSIALNTIEESFWDFCDNYLELVKTRSYSDIDSVERKSALATLSFTLNTYLRLFAIFTPFITEEIWNSSFEQGSSVHLASWPSDNDFKDIKIPENILAYELASNLISEIRSKKTVEQKSLKWEVSKLNINCNKDQTDLIKSIIGDIIRAGNIIEDGIIFSEAKDFNVNVELSTTFEK